MRVPDVIPASVLVYRETIGQPSVSRMRRISSGAAGAPPVPATRTAEKSVRGRSGCSSTNAHCVGTPVAIVTPSSRTRRSASVADHGSVQMRRVVRLASSSHTRVM